jgi:hypothetical protein
MRFYCNWCGKEIRCSRVRLQEKAKEFIESYAHFVEFKVTASNTTMKGFGLLCSRYCKDRFNAWFYD